MPDVHYTRKLSCERCGNAGETVADSMGPFHVSGHFYLRTPKRMEGSLEIMCNRCGTQHKRPRPDLP